MKDDEFHVAAILDHWPHRCTRAKAKQHLLRWEEGVYEDSWSNEIDVHGDLLDKYWERKGHEMRQDGAPIPAVEVNEKKK